jgi:hypothetical protein
LRIGLDTGSGQGTADSEAWGLPEPEEFQVAQLVFDVTLRFSATGTLTAEPDA